MRYTSMVVDDITSSLTGDDGFPALSIQEMIRFKVDHTDNCPICMYPNEIGTEWFGSYHWAPGMLIPRFTSNGLEL